MPVDYHVHLEEGPYTFSWLMKTILAIDEFSGNNLEIGSRERILKQIEELNTRVERGCYSEEWLDLYLKKAKQIGLKEVGIVDHLYRFHETRDYFEKYMNVDPNDSIGKLQKSWLSHVMTEDMGEFVDLISDAKKRWEKQGVDLRLGIEADYFVGGERELTELISGYPWDYVIGSIHFVDGWGFDNPETVHRFDEVDLKEIHNSFYNSVEKMIRSKMFDFVAHLDNIKVFNHKVTDQAFNQAWYDRIGNALVETNTATEINAGLFYRYPVKEMCPGPDYLKTLVAKGVPITLSSDSHYPNDLGKYVFENRDLLKSLNVDEVATFKGRKRILKTI